MTYPVLIQISFYKLKTLNMSKKFNNLHSITDSISHTHLLSFKNYEIRGLSLMIQDIFASCLYTYYQKKQHHTKLKNKQIISSLIFLVSMSHFWTWHWRNRIHTTKIIDHHLSSNHCKKPKVNTSIKISKKAIFLSIRKTCWGHRHQKQLTNLEYPRNSQNFEQTNPIMSLFNKCFIFTIQKCSRYNTAFLFCGFRFKNYRLPPFLFNKTLL